MEAQNGDSVFFFQASQQVIALVDSPGLRFKWYEYWEESCFVVYRKENTDARALFGAIAWCGKSEF